MIKELRIRGLRRREVFSGVPDRATRGSLFFTLVVTYMLVLIIPILIFMGAFSRMQRQFEEEVLRSNTVMLEQVCGSLDSQIRSARQAVNEITVNPVMYRFLQGNRRLDSSKRIEMIQVIGNLAALQTANSENLDQIYLYLPLYDMVASPGSVQGAPLYYGFSGSYDGVGFEQWMDMLAASTADERIIPLRQNGHDILAFVCRLPVRGQECVMVIHLKVDSMQKALEDIAGINQSNVYIMDDDGNIVISKISDRAYPGPAALLSSGDDFRGEYFVKLISSGVSDWKYLSVTSRKALFSQVDYARAYAVTLLAAGLAIGALAALRFAAWNTKPVRNIVQLINTRVGADEAKPRNEFSYIAGHFERLFSERQGFFDTLEQQKPLVQKSFFNELVKRKPEEPGDLSVLPTRFPHDGFLVAALCVEGRELTQRDLNEIFISIHEEIQRFGYAGYVFEESMRSVLLVLNLPLEIKDTLRHAVPPLLEKIKHCFLLWGYQSVSIGVGGLKPSLGELYLSRRESQQALRQKIILGHGAIVFWCDLMEPEPEGYSSRSLEQEIRLMSSIRRGDYEQALTISGAIIDSALETIGGSPENALHFIIDFAGMIIKAMDDMNLSRDDLPGLGCDPRECLMGSETIPALRENARLILQHICRFVEAGKKSHNNKLRERIVEYVENNYTSEDISVQQICEHVSISPSYLSRFFKESMGENLKDYLLRARVKKAKELLHETSYSVCEIAKMIGYINVNTFIRVFKKQEGVTPGQYRDMLMRITG